MKKKIGGGVLAALLVVAASTFAWAEAPVGGVSFHERSVAAGIGYSWGAGVLHYQGKNHPFKVSGLSVLQLGAEDVTAQGSVFYLKKLTDFNGNYMAAGADITVGGGGGGTVMKNQNGVVIVIHTTTQGVDIKNAAEGLKITLE